MQTLTRWVVRAFPAPSYLMMPSTAVDISPNSIKILTGHFSPLGCLPQEFDEVFLPEGAIADGGVKDEREVVTALTSLRERHNLRYVAVSIPEDALYLYTLQVEGALTQDTIMQQIEFTFSEHVPFTASDAVYDFDVVDTYHNSGGLVSVTAAPRQTIESYEHLLSSAGLVPKTLELEAHAITRSVCCMCSDVEIVVDVGHNRAAVIVAKRAIPIFTATIDGGGQDEATVITGVKKHFTFWDTRSDEKGRRVERVARVLLCGGGASAKLAATLRKELGVAVEPARVWQHLFDTDDYIPSIPAEQSKSMATLAGLLLNNKV